MNTITEDQFQSLRHGDIVQWGPDRLNFRTILLGPGDMKHAREIQHARCHFPIKHRSWTRRLCTIYGWSELREKIRYTGERTRDVFSPEELFNFLRWCRKPSDQFKRDLIDLFDNEYHRSTPHLQLKCSAFWRGCVERMMRTLKEAKL